jgi:hypothetical protein
MTDPVQEKNGNGNDNNNTNNDAIMMNSANGTTDNNDSDAEVEVEASLNSNALNDLKAEPGKGWSNGDIRPEMFPLTRDGKLQLYSGTRRWIGLNKGWSRVGGDEDGDQYSHRTLRSSQMGSLLSASSSSITTKMLDEEALSVRSLIAQLCEQYYKFGWATGTGGGVSIRVGGPSENRPWRVFVAPSGIQKGTLRYLRIFFSLLFFFLSVCQDLNLTIPHTHARTHVNPHFIHKNRGYDR